MQRRPLILVGILLIGIGYSAFEKYRAEFLDAELPRFGFAMYCAVVCGFVLFKALLWDDMPIPREHRVSKQYYREKSRRMFLTGGASGVGRHMAITFAKQGHQVFACDINENGLRETCEIWSAEKPKGSAGEITTCALDVGSGAQWQHALSKAVEKMGGIDVLLNIAGFANPGKTSNATERDIDIHLNVNVKGVMLGTSFGGKLMEEQVKAHGGSCHIVNFASMGAIAPCKGMSLYLGAKYGCRGYSLCAAKDFWGSGVYITVVLPEAIQTNMFHTQMATKGSYAALSFAGPILTVQDVERALVDDILPNRPRERIVSTSIFTAKGARFSDIFSSSWLLNTVEEILLQRGLKYQEQVFLTKQNSQQ